MRTFAVALLIGAAVAAQEPVRTTVGMPAVVPGIVLPGGEFEPIDATLKSPVVLRIEHVQKHGTAHRYTIQFTGLEAGEYDLATFLRRKDRSDIGALPKIPVVVEAVRDEHQHEPNELQAITPPALGGYERTMWTLGIAWAIGLLAILFAFRKRAGAEPAVARPLTIADRLRPIVARALEGRLEPAGHAELERLLLSVWRRRLSLEHATARDAIAALRVHDEAGALLRALDQWLHAKEQAPLDLDALLRPYAEIRDEGALA